MMIYGWIWTIWEKRALDKKKKEKKAYASKSNKVIEVQQPPYLA